MEQIGDIDWNLVLSNYGRATTRLRTYLPDPWHHMKKIKCYLYVAVEQEYHLVINRCTSVCLTCTKSLHTNPHFLLKFKFIQVHATTDVLQTSLLNYLFDLCECLISSSSVMGKREVTIGFHLQLCVFLLHSLENLNRIFQFGMVETLDTIISYFYLGLYFLNN